MITTTLLTALAAASAPAQDSSLAQLPDAVTPARLTALSHELLLDEPGDGTTWARGRNWKASFGPEGLTYIPFFGSDAPQNYPIEFDLNSVTLDGESLTLSERTRSRTGREVTLERGALREIYHAKRETLEQTFVFDRLPSRGELILDLDVTTELTMHREGRGFSFSNSLGSVQYGAATVLDSTGRSLRLVQSMTKNGFRIVVPADFVASAVLPLTVDPILSSHPIENDTRRQVDVDVAYEGNNSTYQIVFSEIQSALDYDVIVVNFNAPLEILFPASSIDLTSATWRQPRNASCYFAQEFLCIAVVGNTIGQRRVHGRTRHAGTSIRGPQFPISGFGGEAADVGGNGGDFSTSFDFMVVWQEADAFNQDSNIVAQAVTDGSTLTGNPIQIDPDVSDLDRVPAISKSSGRPNQPAVDHEYMIVWERENSPSDHDIQAQVIEYTGNFATHDQFNAYSFSDSLDPDVSTQSTASTYNDERYWVLVFERLIAPDYDIFAVVARDGDADNARNINVMQDLDTNLDHRDPTIAFDSYDFLVLYQTESDSGDFSLHYTGINVVHDDGELRTGVSERRATLGTSLQTPGHFGLASHWDGGGPSMSEEPGSAFAGLVARFSPGEDEEVVGHVLAEIAEPVFGSQYCRAEENSSGAKAWIRATWFFAPEATDSIVLRCSEMPQNQFGFFLVSNQVGFAPNAGGSNGNLCLAGSIGRFSQPGQIKSSGSTGEFALAVDGEFLASPNAPVAAMSGETWYFQAWFRDGPTGSNFSNGVAVTYD